jgi:methionyl-tRNA synthetase
MTTSLITTAIPFVNAEPHLGFAYELVLADVLARHARQRGRPVHFTTGTDDNSLKNVVAAARAGLSPRELVDRNAASFRALAPLLDISIDDFISTSTDGRHVPVVHALWRACAARGDLYRRTWHGRYCAGCEAFVDDNVTRCDEHGTEPEPVHEDNWFFRLSRYRDAVRTAITSKRVSIVPDSARAETLAFLDGDVRDLSVSRDTARSQGWGIPVPDDPSQVIYVWFDALANYLSVVGGADHWRQLANRTHVIGKGITRFHAVYWLAFLLAAELPLPERIYVHGYLTVNGRKISKSSGVRVDVPATLEEVGADALRWYFARHCRTRVDSDVSVDGVIAAYNRDLVDGLGNLAQRCCVLGAKVGGIPEQRDDARASELRPRVDAALDAFAIDDAAATIVALVDDANRELERTQPWRLARHDARAAAQLLAGPLDAARLACEELAPFVPGVAQAIKDRLRSGEAPPPLTRRQRRVA